LLCIPKSPEYGRGKKEKEAEAMVDLRGRVRV